jgi:hypothetical protein
MFRFQANVAGILLLLAVATANRDDHVAGLSFPTPDGIEEVVRRRWNEDTTAYPKGFPMRQSSEGIQVSGGRTG